MGNIRFLKTFFCRIKRVHRRVAEYENKIILTPEEVSIYISGGSRSMCVWCRLDWGEWGPNGAVIHVLCTVSRKEKTTMASTHYQSQKLKEFEILQRIGDHKVSSFHKC